ncbi:MAG: choice-of-anchor Q domain-containing protein [Paludibacter sp.]|nr:choice-of-anchor Q domain-containing protein [Paludibacter sp.]
MKREILLFFVITILSLFTVTVKATTRYVKPTSSGLVDGTSWANASSDLQLMINNSSYGDEVWVAAGTYYPNRKANAISTITLNDRNNAFVLKSGVKIYGGFVGNDETLLSQRNWTKNITILSGDLGTVGTKTDNAYHVVISSGAVGTAELNGFTVTSAQGTDGSEPQVNAYSIKSSWGGGIFCTHSSPILANLIITSNSAKSFGGGIYISDSSPIISNTRITSNSSDQWGGGIFIASSSSPAMLNVVIDNNYTLYHGGGIRNESTGVLTITNALIYKNTSGQDGAGISSTSSTTVLTNTTIVYNTAASGSVGGVEGGGIVYNSIIWGNKVGSATNNVSGSFTYSYSLLEGGTLLGTSIISNSNPTFTDITTDDYHLKRTSSVVNKGLNSLNNSATDLDGNSRIFDSSNGGVIDLGAYEYQSEDATISPFTNGIMYVKKGGTGDGTSWTDAIGELSDAISSASGSSVTQIWVAAGTYYPMYVAGNGTTDRDKAFVLPNNIKIYGGFAGTESSVDSRNIKSNASILSGDLGTIGNTSDNAFHVIISSGSVGTAELNGFTISDGRAINYTDRTVNSNAVKSSEGGGIYCIYSSPILSNLIIKSNYAQYHGGGIYNANSSPTITNVLVCNNTSDQGGAGININSGAPTILNSTIATNTSTGDSYAGGIDGGCTVKNSIIYGNKAKSSVSNVTGSITYLYTLLEGGTVSGTSIISNSDPIFVDTNSDNYRLTRFSPAVNKGLNSLNNSTSDLDGNSRIFDSSTGGVIDLGAYEYQSNDANISPFTNGVMYVKKGGTGDGTSWANAIGELADAINSAKLSSFVTQIWVATGTYYPLYYAGNGTTNRDKAFVLVNNIKIFGGFAGNETLLSQQNWTTNATILSGDIGTIGSSTDNCYHVVISAGAIGTAELNGFIITGANADVNNTITVNSNSISGENGAGVFCSTSSPLLTNLKIDSNTAKLDGGGMLITTNSAPLITNSIISNNISSSNGDWRYGGGIYNDGSSSPIIINSLIYKNSCKNGGGGIYSASGSPILINVTIVNNTAVDGGDVSGGISGNMTIKNSIIWGNKKGSSIVSNVKGTITYTTTLVEGISETGIISNSDPLFANVNTNDYNLTDLSPAINKGSNILNTTTTDLAGNSRFFEGGIIDLGAYENQTEIIVYEPDVNGVLYVKKGSSGNGSSWTNAIGELSDALSIASGLSSVNEIWVTADIYYPAKYAGTGTTNRDKAFVLLNNIKIYGGFGGTETSLTQRNINANETILSGDIGTIDDTSDNCYHVVISAGAVGTACLDGFTVTKGNANGSSNITVNTYTISQGNGGGIHLATSAPTFANLVITSNNATLGGGTSIASSTTTFNNSKINTNTSTTNGGGIYCYISTLTLKLSELTNNTAATNGGGIYTTGSSSYLSFTNNLVKNNIATSGSGGGMYLDQINNSSPFKGLLICNNQAGQYGGGIYKSNSMPVFTNLTITENKAGTSGGGLHMAGDYYLKNSIVWGNSNSNTSAIDNLTIGNSWYYNNTLLQGATLNGTNIISNSDPKFIDSSTGDYHLNASSPAKDIGNNTYIDDVTTDLDGLRRVFNIKVDLGAYEYQLPIVVSEVGNDTETGYNELNDAFNAIEAGTHTGDLVIKIGGNSTRAALNASGTGSASYSSILIYPTVSGCTLSINETKSLFEFNGADNITIDGRVNQSGPVDLTFVNLETTSGSSHTIYFADGATNNTVKYCNIKGASSRGIIDFATTSNSIGNSNNVIDHCNITNSGKRTASAIYSQGTTLYPNSNNIISNNNIYDVLDINDNSMVININSCSTDFTIIGNSIYETTALVPTVTGKSSCPIYVNNTSGGNFVIKDNYIGGSAPLCAGDAGTINAGASHIFQGIYMNVGSSVSSSIQNNTIKNIDYSSSNILPWSGIYINAGAVNIGTETKNTIGEITGNNSITISNTTANSISYGILDNSGSTVNIKNNNIGSITTIGSGTFSSSFVAISKSNSSANCYISNNNIGSASTSNSIQASSPSSSATGQVIIGIENNTADSILISSNTISNLHNAYEGTNTSAKTVGIESTNGTSIIENNMIYNISSASGQVASNENATVIGINQPFSYGSTLAQIVSGNIIHNLSNINPSAEVNVHGIFLHGKGSTSLNTIQSNYIFDLAISSTNTSSSISGIASDKEATINIYNNIVSLGTGISSSYRIKGIENQCETENNYNIYFNSIYIGGTTSGTTSSTFALCEASQIPIRNYRNNVLCNVRSGGTTGKHYAISLKNSLNLTIGNNNYYAPNGVIAQLNSSDVTALPILSSSDARSVTLNPQFINPESTTTAENYKVGVDLIGDTSTGISTDYELATRGRYTSMGAWERTLTNKWKGSTNSNWSTSTNWTCFDVPTTDDKLLFDSEVENNCVLDCSVSLTDITNDQSTYNFDLNGNTAIVKGDLILTNGAIIDASAINSTIIFAGSSTQDLSATNFTDNKIYNLTINNESNVTLSGILNLLNNTTASTGKLDATTNMPTINYSGTTTQFIDSTFFLDGKVYNLTIDNSAGVSLRNDFIVENTLNINPEKSITIPTGKQLNVIGRINNNAGVSGIVVKAGSTAPNGSLIYYNPKNEPVLGTVEMYTKAFYDSNGPTDFKYKWQFFGIPLRSIQAQPTFDGSYLRQYNEPASSWLAVTNSTILEPVKGYEITQTTPKTIYFQGELVNGDITHSLTYTSGANAGFHIISNPYTCALDVSEIEFANLEETIYMYNTGSSKDWEANSGSIVGSNAGQYTAVPKNSAGYPGLPDQIPSMQGFMVATNSGGGTITFTYDNVAVENSTLQRIKRKNISNENKTVTVVSLNGTHSGDRMWLITDPLCTRNFDNGYDGYKISGASINASIYAVEPDGNYQVDAINDINNTELMFKPGIDSTYTLTFTHQNLSSTYPALYLIDLMENKTINISQNSSKYSFTAKANLNPLKRFKIVTSPGLTTDMKNEVESFKPLSILISNKTIRVQNNTSEKGKLLIYDVSGKLIDTSSFNSNSETLITKSFKSGVYSAKAITNENKFVVNFIWVE